MARVSPQHLEARRQSIFDAAQRVFARRGQADASMAEIATEAGISPGLIYRYFPNKHALALACVQEGGEQAVSEWHTITKEVGDPGDAFSRIAHKSFAELKLPDAADYTRLMVENFLNASRSQDPELREALIYQRNVIAGGLCEALQGMADAHELPPEIDPPTLAQALLAFYYGVRMSHMVDPTLDADAMLTQLEILMQRATPCA